MIDFDSMAVGDVHDLPERWLPDARAEYNRAQALTVSSGGKVLFEVISTPLPPEKITMTDKHSYKIKRTA